MKRILAAIAVALTVGCTQIDSGNVGVESFMGQVKTEQTLPNGVYFTLFKTVTEISAKEIAVDLSDMQPKTEDNVTLQDLDISIVYQIAPVQAAKLFVRYAGDLVYSAEAGAYFIGNGVVKRLAREAAYREAAKYHSSTAHTKRTEIANGIRTALQAEIDSDIGKGTFVVTNVVVRTLVTDPRLEESIKAAAQVEFQTRQKNQQKELARAESERLKIEAEGIARANKIVAESLTPALIEMRRVEALAKFAENKGTTTVVLPSNAMPLVQVK